MSGRGRVVVLAGIVGALLGVAVVLLAVAAGLMSEAEVYWSRFATDQAIEVDDEQFRYYNDLYVNAYTLTGLARPLLLASIAAGLLLLAVLAVRRDRRRQSPGASPRAAIPRRTSSALADRSSVSPNA